MTIIILFAFVGSSVAFALISAFPSENQVQADWGASIVIRIFNERYTVPAEIGVTNQSRAKLFTISPDGKIYKTGTEDANLGDFFKIWNETFNGTCILDYCNNENNSLMMYAWKDGKWTLNYEYENYVLKNGDTVLIDYK